MEYNERLMNESLQGNKDSLEELKFNAGSGDCEAQYILAMYYAKACGHLHDPDYFYWLEKSKENGYVPGVGKPTNGDFVIGINSTNSMTIWDYLNWCSHIASLLSLL